MLFGRSFAICVVFLAAKMLLGFCHLKIIQLESLGEFVWKVNLEELLLLEWV